MSSPERHQRVMELFDEACDVPIDRRAAFLDQACQSDPALRREVETLLKHDAQPLEFVEKGSRAGGLNLLASDMAMYDSGRRPSSGVHSLPDRIGRYRIIRKVGEGGMGVVFEAEQENPRRTVAVKVINAAVTSAGMLQRFEHEAHVLGRLQHPGIAQIFEAGTFDTGAGAQPFLAMEMIHGKPLIDFANQRGVDTRQRLALMATICEAVQHAHQRGVIHRDLKPANILVVDQRAETLGTTTRWLAVQPKILDFGVARVTDSDLRLTTMQTSVGQLIGTLAYMSPEQVLADHREIDTRSDVYALGVVLYELLAGRLPHDVSSRSIPEAVRVIRDHSPTRLSAINRLFRGDIDTIVSKALEKDPARRYQSAAELGADIRRFLNNEPIVARRASAFYQIKKFAARNKKLVSVATIFALLLIAGAVVSMIFGLQAIVARGIADEAKDLAETKSRIAEAETVKARRAAYLANMAAVDAALQVNDSATARRRLQAVDTSYRSTWEWRHFDSQLDQSLAALTPPGRGAFDVAISPDSKYLASADTDGIARIWDLNSRTVVAELAGSHGDSGSLAYSPDGRRLACGGQDGAVRVFDSTSRQLQHRIQAHAQPIIAVAFSPDNLRLATASADSTAKLWDARSGKLIEELIGHSGWVVAVTFSPDGRWLATGSADKTVRLWSLPQTPKPVILVGHRSQVNGLDFSPDGTQLASASTDRTVRIWNVADGRELRVLRGHRDDIHDARFSPDGRLIATASDDSTVRAWDMETGVEAAVFRAHTGRVGAVAWSPDQTIVASCSLDDPIRLWDAALIQGVNMLRGHEQGAYCVAFSPDGSRIATGASDATARLWDADTATPIAVLRGHGQAIHSLAFFPDGLRLATGSHDRTIRLWSTITGDQEAVINAHGGLVNSVAVRPDGRAIASASDDGTARVWDSQSHAELLRLDHAPYSVRCVAFRPDGSQLATGAMDAVVRLWDADNGTLLQSFRGHSRGVIGLAFSPDGSCLATASDDSTVRLWDPATGELVTPPLVHPTAVGAVGFTSDGKRVITGCSDSVVRLWDPELGDEVAHLRGHEYAVISIAASPDGSRLASGSLEKSPRLWETQPIAARLESRRLRAATLEQARPIVQHLMQTLADPADAAFAIEKDTTIRDPMRRAALDLILAASTDAK